jgi:exodeoxyribonuclease VIII
VNNIMIDLETMGNGPQSAIIAIGAVEFDIETQTLGTKFYQLVDLASSVAQGGVMDASTVLWWLKQSDAARAALNGEGVNIDDALQVFCDWSAECNHPSNLKVWGNGADFDNVILASAYRRSGREQPWPFWGNRCYRTVKGLYPHIKLERAGTHHNALDDAVSQAQHLMAMLKPVAPPAHKEQVQWGIDWGKQGDRTAVSIVKHHPDGRLEVVAMEVEPIPGFRDAPPAPIPPAELMPYDNKGMP